jgi:glycosyltransferase involved in cell wall biosynthesis
MRHNFRPGCVMHVTGSLQSGGAEQFVCSLTRALEQIGVPTIVLTIAKEKAHLGSVPVLSADRQSRYDFGFFFRMVALIRANRPSVVHTHGYHGKLWGRLAARLAGVKNIVHTEHNSAFRQHPIQDVVNAALHRRTNAIVTFSDVLADMLVREDRVPRERVVVIPNGVPQPSRRLRWPVPRIDPPVHESAKLILHVGRLMPVKNQQVAIDALRELCDLRPAQRYCLLIVGAGPDKEKLEAHARSLGVADRVRFLGHRNDIENLMRRSDVLLITSRNEAMPLTALEAMYAGIPIVTTPWKGASELLERGTLGRIAADFDASSVSAALSKAFEDRTETLRLADAAFSAARSRFDIRLTARKYAALYARYDVATT